jgi:glycosyltransferase involved in cell wall biosynthesis
MNGILFYDDSPVFGGHEIMALAGIQAVLEASPTPVTVMASAQNPTLTERLTTLASSHPHLTLHPIPWASSKLESLRNRLLPSRSRQLAHTFRSLAPSRIIAIQGNIEHSSLALLAARHAKIPSASYIPVPHSNATMGAKLGGIRDLFATPLFLVPDAFITISDEMANMLRQRGAKAAVTVVYNGIDTARFQPGNAAAARAALGLPADKTILGMIGRMEFRQKQQHLLAHAVASLPELRSHTHLVFAGEGPDREPLQSLLQSLDLSATVLPWCDPSQLLQALHALVIPSRYEGLPLVMLEALASATSVLGSDRDGMKDLLPANRRFTPDQPAALAQALQRFLAEGSPPPPTELVHRVRHSMSLPAFHQAFAQAILHPAH